MNTIVSIDSVRKLDDENFRVVMTINESNVRLVQKPFFVTKEEYKGLRIGGTIAWI